MRGVLRLTEQGEVRQSELQPAAHCDAHPRAHIRIRALATAQAAQMPPVPPIKSRPCAASRQHSLEAYRDLVSAARSFSNTSAPRRRWTSSERMHMPHGRGTSRRRRRASAARSSVGVRVDSKPAHAAGMVRLRQRFAGGVGASTARMSLPA